MVCVTSRTIRCALPKKLQLQSMKVTFLHNKLTLREQRTYTDIGIVIYDFTSPLLFCFSWGAEMTEFLLQWTKKPEQQSNILFFYILDHTAWLSDIQAKGNQPEDWLNYANVIRYKQEFASEEDRREYLAKLYARAVKVCHTPNSPWPLPYFSWC